MHRSPGGSPAGADSRGAGVISCPDVAVYPLSRTSAAD